MASEKAAHSLADYVSRCANVYFAQQDHDDAKCVSDLLQGVREVHDEVRTEAEREGRPGAATTLTLVVLFWPKAYLVHVGDSRAYRLRDHKLQLLSHDQTVAQALIDAGALTASKGEASPLKHILTSDRGREARPVRSTPPGPMTYAALHRRADQARDRGRTRGDPPERQARSPPFAASWTLPSSGAAAITSRS
jgi:protein phosphatase